MRILRFVTCLVLVFLCLAPGRSAAEDCRWEWRQECALQGEPPRMVCFWVPVRVCDDASSRAAGQVVRFSALFATAPALAVSVGISPASPAVARAVLEAAGHANELLTPPATARPEDRPCALRLELPLDSAAAILARIQRVPGVTKITPAP